MHVVVRGREGGRGAITDLQSIVTSIILVLTVQCFHGNIILKRLQHCHQRNTANDRVKIIKKIIQLTLQHALPESSSLKRVNFIYV